MTTTDLYYWCKRRIHDRICKWRGYINVKLYQQDGSVMRMRYAYSKSNLLFAYYIKKNDRRIAA